MVCIFNRKERNNNKYLNSITYKIPFKEKGKFIGIKFHKHCACHLYGILNGGLYNSDTRISWTY